MIVGMVEFSGRKHLWKESMPYNRGEAFFLCVWFLCKIRGFVRCSPPQKKKLLMKREAGEELFIAAITRENKYFCFEAVPQH